MNSKKETNRLNRCIRCKKMRHNKCTYYKRNCQGIKFCIFCDDVKYGIIRESSKRELDILDQLIDGGRRTPGNFYLYTPHTPDGKPIDPKSLISDGKLVTIGGRKFRAKYTDDGNVLFVEEN